MFANSCDICNTVYASDIPRAKRICVVVRTCYKICSIKSLWQTGSDWVAYGGSSLSAWWFSSMVSLWLFGEKLVLASGKMVAFPFGITWALALQWRREVEEGKLGSRHSRGWKWRGRWDIAYPARAVLLILISVRVLLSERYPEWMWMFVASRCRLQCENENFMKWGGTYKLTCSGRLYDTKQVCLGLAAKQAVKSQIH